MLRPTPPGRCVTTPGDEVRGKRRVPGAGELIISIVAPPTTTTGEQFDTSVSLSLVASTVFEIRGIPAISAERIELSATAI
jgi:hypothetical protein